MLEKQIIEKDYYVCLVLKELAKKQDYLKAYFKGGTAVYKILDTMNRFSEDIDLTVKILPEESNTRKKKRLKESALGYETEGLELIKDECIDNKGSITKVYQYTSVYKDSEIPLKRAGKIQVESTSFTVSEPTEKYYIEPLIYKLAYDISVLFNNDEIQKLLNNKDELNKLIQYKRQEEKVRIGGIDGETEIKDFSYFKLEFSDVLIREFENMQNKYVLNDKYKFSIDQVKEILNKIYRQI